MSIFRKIKKILLVILSFSKLNLSFRFVAGSAENTPTFLNQSAANDLKHERVEVRPQSVQKTTAKNVIYKKIILQKNKNIFRALAISNPIFSSFNKKDIPIDVYVRFSRCDYFVDYDLLNDNFFSDKAIESDSIDFLMIKTEYARHCRSQVD
jgi:hypothetical protein